MSLEKTVQEIIVETLAKTYGITVKDGELYIETKRLHVDPPEVQDDE